MGSMSFFHRVKAADAQDAFNIVRDDAYAEYMSDHDSYDGYSGTIYEKYEFRRIKLPEGMTAETLNARLEEDSEFSVDGFNPFNDKFGPAGCVDEGNGSFVFFGCAAS